MFLHRMVREINVWCHLKLSKQWFGKFWCLNFPWLKDYIFDHTSATPYSQSHAWQSIYSITAYCEICAPFLLYAQTQYIYIFNVVYLVFVGVSSVVVIVLRWCNAISGESIIFFPNNNMAITVSLLHIQFSDSVAFRFRCFLSANVPNHRYVVDFWENPMLYPTKKHRKRKRIYFHQKKKKYSPELTENIYFFRGVRVRLILLSLSHTHRCVIFEWNFISISRFYKMWK